MKGRLHIEIESSFEKLDCCGLSLSWKLFVLGVIANKCFTLRPLLLSFLALNFVIYDKFCVLFFRPLLPKLLLPLLGKLAMDILSIWELRPAEDYEMKSNYTDLHPYFSSSEFSVSTILWSSGTESRLIFSSGPTSGSVSKWITSSADL